MSVPRPSIGSAGDGAATGAAVRPGGAMLSFLLVGEIVNFPLLRRQLGIRRADGLAAEVACRLHALLPESTVSVVGRATVQVAFVGSSVEAGRAALAEMAAAVAEPFDFDGERHRVRVAFGGAVCGAEDDDVRLAEVAEAVAREAASTGEDALRPVTDPAFGDPAVLVADLPAAIDDGQMFLQYQPKVHIRQQKVASAEALIRWRHPVRGLILPGDFIEAAERFGVIGKLTLWTLRRVIEDQRRLSADGHDMPVFINISGLLIGDAAFVADAEAILRGSGARIGFEITETAVIRDPESAIANLQRFADIGVTIAIDDYGAGLSSLAYLKRLPARELKIDKLFVTQLTSSNRDPLIVRSTIDLAHALNMEVTAEGVETQASLALLSVMGCDVVQGYLISRPIEFDAFLAFLNDQRHLAIVTAPRPMFGRNEGFRRAGA